MKPHTVGFIFARGGSKGLPRKNIRLLAGKPLIAHAIETARGCALIDRVIVSTDDVEIADTARRFGAEVPFIRPAELARDDSSEWAAWQHAIRTLNAAGGKEMGVFVSIPTTAPLRRVDDVESCIRMLRSTDADLVITVSPAQRSPYFNMVLMENGYARLVIPPAESIHQRQAAPPVYDMTTVAYAARPTFVLKAQSMFEGKVRAVVIPPERALDIDTELDLRMAEFLLTPSAPTGILQTPGVEK